MRVLSSGDKSIDVPGVGRTDELGGMAEAVQVFKDNMIAADQLAAAGEAERQAKTERAARLEKLVREFESKAETAVGSLTSASRRRRIAKAHSTKAGIDIHPFYQIRI